MKKVWKNLLIIAAVLAAVVVLLVKFDVFSVIIDRISAIFTTPRDIEAWVIGSLENVEFDPGEKQYSFGALSDVHLSVPTAESDFTNALEEYKDQGAEFVCICGDLTNNGNDTQLAMYKQIVDASGMTVRAVTGNHDTYTYNADIEQHIQAYTGDPLYYTFTRGDDVFIMLGIKSEGALFTDAELQWFYETLEANRNKRCFIFQHCMLGNGNVETCGNAGGLYHSYCWSGNGQTQMEVFKSLLAHYKNTIWFHGHSHFKFRFQTEEHPYANVDNSDGFHSVHIPSVTEPRVEDGPDEDVKPDYDYDGSEGYMVDVYDSGIHLRGIDFITGEELSIASYWLDTTLHKIPARTYTDPTGTITKHR